MALLAVDLYRYANFLDERGLTALEARGQFQEVSFLPYFRRLSAGAHHDLCRSRGDRSARNGERLECHPKPSRRWARARLTGKGWREGLQARLGYLPRSVAHNDFIFAVLAEEKVLSAAFSSSGVCHFACQRDSHRGLRARSLGMLLCMGVTVILFPSRLHQYRHEHRHHPDYGTNRFHSLVTEAPLF